MNAPLPQTATAQAIRYIPLIDLCRSPTNPRRTFPADKLAEMADSIARHGVLQPVLVRAWPEGQAYPESLAFVRGNDQALPRYEIVAGERRCRAAAMAGTELVPAIVRHLSDNEVLEIQIVENLQREEVHPIEEAEGYQTLMQRTGCSAEELAAKVGRSKAYIYARLKLCALCEAGREAFREGKLNASTALLIARIPGEKLQAEAISAIVDNWDGPLSYRRAVQLVQQRYTLRLGDAPFDLDSTTLLPGVGACAACPSRSGNQPELFADIESADVCTDPGCYQRKREAWAEIKRAAAAAAGHTVITGDKAEKIAPTWATLANLANGYVALDARCYEAKQVREVPPEPEEPSEPEGDFDEDTPEWKAYDAAMAAWEKAHDEWEIIAEAACPTWREALAGDTFAVTFVQHPRTGDVIECAKESELLDILRAKGWLEEDDDAGGVNTNFSRQDDHSKLVAKAKEETAYRARLLDRILFAQGCDPLQHADLVAVAQALFARISYGDDKKIMDLFGNGETAAEAFKASIVDLAPSELNRLLLAMAIVGDVGVNWYDLNKKEPTALIAAAARWGVDADEVRKQGAQEGGAE